MQKHTFRLYEIDQAAAWLYKHLEAGQVVAFFGEMGAGKTTLIKALCQHVGVTDEVNSPTFALINEYHTTGGKSIFHFDLYRIDDIEEIFDLGFDDYFANGYLTLIEWPDKMKGYLPEEALKVELHVNADGTRTIAVPEEHTLKS